MSKEIKILTWNVDGNLDRIGLGGHAYETHKPWHIHQRIHIISKKVIEEKPDIAFLQEIRQFEDKNTGENVDSETPLKSSLEEVGYTVITNYSNSSKYKAFKYLTAFNTKRFKIDIEGNHLKYFTSTGDSADALRDKEASEDEIKEHNYGALWERGAAVTHVYDKQNSEQEICVFNVHAAVPLTARMKLGEKLASYVDDEIAVNKNIQIIIAGTFNSFSDWGGDEQIAALEQTKLSHFTKEMTLSDGKTPANFTYIAFPFDFGAKIRSYKKDGSYDKMKAMEPAPRKEYIHQLFEDCKILDNVDGILGYNLQLFQNQKPVVKTFHQFSPEPEIYDEDTISKYILDHPEGPITPSDNQCIIAYLVGEGNQDSSEDS